MGARTRNRVVVLAVVILAITACAQIVRWRSSDPQVQLRAFQKSFLGRDMSSAMTTDGWAEVMASLREEGVSERDSSAIISLVKRDIESCQKGEPRFFYVPMPARRTRLNGQDAWEIQYAWTYLGNLEGKSLNHSGVIYVSVGRPFEVVFGSRCG